MTHRKGTIAVVGCGFGGATLARRLAGRLNAETELVAFNSGPDLYNYTILPRTLVEDIPESHVTLSLKGLFRGRPVDFRQEKVVAVHARERLLRTEHSELAYDYLVLALGSKAVPLDRDDASFVLYPKLFRHLARLRQGILAAAGGEQPANWPDSPAYRYAVVGGGLTGIEFAIALHEAIAHACARYAGSFDRFRVDLFEMAGRLAPGASERFSHALKGLLKRRGVGVYLNSRVLGVENQHLVVHQGTPIPADVVLCCIGSRPNLRLALTGLGSTDDGVPVNPYLQSTDDARVFAVGDNARIGGLAMGADTHFASQAIRQAKVATDNIHRHLHGRRLRAYAPGGQPVGVMLGAENGALAFRQWHYIGRLAGRVKRHLEMHCT